MQPNPVLRNVRVVRLHHSAPAVHADETTERDSYAFLSEDLEGDGPVADAVVVIEDDDTAGMTFSIVVDTIRRTCMASASGKRS